MALNTPVIGPGGSGFQGVGSNSAAGVLTELQGLSIELLAGAGADTKIDVAAIRQEDTILKALNNNAGTITDITSSMSINSVKATGTLTASTIIAGSECSVAGKSYVFQAGAPVKYGEVQVGADDDESITNLAAAITAYENSVGRGGAQVTASPATTVCTITAVADGTSGNALGLTTEDGTIVVSGATLAGGTGTGGVQSTGVTNQVILFWYNKQ